MAVHLHYIAQSLIVSCSGSITYRSIRYVQSRSAPRSLHRRTALLNEIHCTSPSSTTNSDHHQWRQNNPQPIPVYLPHNHIRLPNLDNIARNDFQILRLADILSPSVR